MELRILKKLKDVNNEGNFLADNFKCSGLVADGILSPFVGLTGIQFISIEEWNALRTI